MLLIIIFFMRTIYNRILYDIRSSCSSVRFITHFSHECFNDKIHFAHRKKIDVYLFQSLRALISKKHTHIIFGKILYEFTTEIYHENSISF